MPVSEMRLLMKKTITITLEEQELLELLQVLYDDDTEGALAFLKRHLKSKVRSQLAGDRKIKIHPAERISAES
jgi:hypothetical protein